MERSDPPEVEAARSTSEPPGLEEVPPWFRERFLAEQCRRTVQVVEETRRNRRLRVQATLSGGIAAAVSILCLGDHEAWAPAAFFAVGAVSAYIIARREPCEMYGALVYAVPLIVLSLVGEVQDWIQLFVRQYPVNDFFWVWTFHGAFGAALAFLVERERLERLPY